MKRILLALLAVLPASLPAQNMQMTNPSDILNSLPPLSFDVCAATKPELEAYDARLNKVTAELTEWSQMIARMRSDAMTQGKINPHAQIESLSNRRDKAQSMITAEDFDSKIKQAASEDRQAVAAQLNKNGEKMQHATTEGDIQALTAEYESISVAHCNKLAPKIGSLLEQWLAAEKKNADYVVAVSDLNWQIKCTAMGYTYHRELAYEEEYGRIANIVASTSYLVSLFPFRESH